MLSLLQAVASSIKTTGDTVGEAVLAGNVALHLLLVALLAGLGSLVR